MCFLDARCVCMWGGVCAYYKPKTNSALIFHSQIYITMEEEEGSYLFCVILVAGFLVIEIEVSYPFI